MYEGRLTQAMAPGQSATISVPKARGRRQCSCCPYGYHIDLDFVRYCEVISNSELLPRRAEKFRPKRNKTPSMEVLLGIQQEQWASSLERMKELEEQVKIIPILQKQLYVMRDEKLELIEELMRRKEKISECEKIRESLNAEMMALELMQDTVPKKRSIGVGTNVITREVGVIHGCPVTASTYTDTDELVQEIRREHRFLSLKALSKACNRTDTSTSTLLKMDSIYSEADIERNLGKIVNRYKDRVASFTARPKSNTSVHVQVSPETRSITTSAQPQMIYVAVQTAVPSTRDIGVSEDTTSREACPKCTVQRRSVGVMATIPTVSLQALGPTKTYKSVGSGGEKASSTSKSTDTDSLRPRREVAVNTMKRKLVDAGVEACKLDGLPSRIPRPETLQIGRAYDTTGSFNTSRSSDTGLQFEEFGSDSGSDDGQSNVKQDTVLNKTTDSVSLFQPIPVQQRKTREPSKEMRAAMKVLNDSLQKSGGNIPIQMKNAINLIQQEWFKISSTANANPLDVEDYLDCFEEISGALLEYIVNMTDVTGNTAMHYAVSHGNFDVVSILLDSKVCNINRPNAAGYTCIMLVSLAQVRSETHRQVVKRLFHMADVNIRAKQHGQTALMLAVSHGRIDTVELLLESGADINIQDEDGSTALMCAAEHGHVDIVKLLLAQPDCDITITDCDGSTALNIAMEAGNRDVGVLLYAQEHFSQGGSPYSSKKHRKVKSTTPTLKTPPTRTPTSPHCSKAK